MLTLYHGGGAADYYLENESFSDEQWERIKHTTCKLLRARGSAQAAELLESLPFRLFDAMNGFGDEFCVLIAHLPFEQYLSLSETYDSYDTKAAASTISNALLETCSKFARFILVGLDSDSALEPVSAPALQITSQAVDRALADAEQLIRTRDAVSGVDRVHTAFHGYLRAVLIRAGADPDKDASITQLYKSLRDTHPALKNTMQEDEVSKIIKASSAIIDAINTIRNRASIAHPNDDLIDEPEAMLVINTVRTLLHYLNAKIGTG